MKSGVSADSKVRWLGLGASLTEREQVTWKESEQLQDVSQQQIL